MFDRASRVLFLTRHGEAEADGGGLTDNGRRQAKLLGQRLSGTPLAAIYHGPLPRAAQTAELVREQLGDVQMRVEEAAGDYVPYAPERHELPVESADALLDFVSSQPARDPERDPELAAEALRMFTGPVTGNTRYELVVTHNFLIGWLVRAAQDAPKWRWLGVNHCNAALTVLRYTPGKPSSVLCFNDMGHLPTELCWTGYPPEMRV